MLIIWYLVSITGVWLDPFLSCLFGLAETKTVVIFTVLLWSFLCHLIDMMEQSAWDRNLFNKMVFTKFEFQQMWLTLEKPMWWLLLKLWAVLPPPVFSVLFFLSVSVNCFKALSLMELPVPLDLNYSRTTFFPPHPISRSSLIAVSIKGPPVLV